jgi:hypothetical protein
VVLYAETFQLELVLLVLPLRKILMIDEGDPATVVKNPPPTRTPEEQVAVVLLWSPLAIVILELVTVDTEAFTGAPVRQTVDEVSVSLPLPVFLASISQPLPFLAFL